MIRLFSLIILCLWGIFANAETVQINGVCYNLDDNAKVAEVTGSSNKYFGDISIPNQVNYKKNIYIVTSIGNFAFDDCKGLTSINIPNSVTSIGNYAFWRCSGLTSITIPNSVTTIGESTFRDCVNLMYMTIPNSVISIGNYAFYGCSGLTSIAIPNSVSTIGESTFNNCSSLRTVTIPNSVVAIGNRAFSGCSSLIFVSIPNSVTSIGESAFSGCSSLISIIIPKSITSIGSFAFVFCSGITSIVVQSSNPLDIDPGCFSGCWDATLYVPSGCKAAYQAASGWNWFKEILESLPYWNFTITPDADSTALAAATSEWTATTSGTINRFESKKAIEGAIKAGGQELTMTKGLNISGAAEKKIRIDINKCIQFSGKNITLSTPALKKDQVVTIEFASTGDNAVTFDQLTNLSGTSGFTAADKNTIQTGTGIVSANGPVAFKSTGGSINIFSISVSEGGTPTENVSEFNSNGVNYGVTSYDDRKVVVARGDYGEVLEVPASVTYQGDSWRVTGIDNGAFGNNAVLSAVIWNPAAPFTLNVSNPNLLLYVTSADYAPASITNVVVGNTAERIVLTDGAQGNDFNCPREFTARKISYTHAYVMTTGVGESKGWETIALPFDVQKITHSSKGEIAPFAARTSDDSRKPFWLMEYGSGGWTRANSIKANKPYIISMPNNTNYKPEYRLAGNITFSGEQVTVKRTTDARPVSYDGKTFTPNFSHITNPQILALNVNNDYVFYSGDSNEGSRFIQDLRPLHPFEAYMTTTSSARWIDISDDMTTGIDEVTAADDGSLCLKVYNLNGQLVTNTEKSIDKVRHELPAGVYIVNGQKLMIRK